MVSKLRLTITINLGGVNLIRSFSGTISWSLEAQKKKVKELLTHASYLLIEDGCDAVDVPAS